MLSCLGNLQARDLRIALGDVVDTIHHGLVNAWELLVPEGHLLARLDVADAWYLVDALLRGSNSLVDTHLRILDEKVELLLTVTDVILIEAIIEVVACILGAKVVWSEDLGILMDRWAWVCTLLCLAGLDGLLLRDYGLTRLGRLLCGLHALGLVHILRCIGDNRFT